MFGNAVGNKSTLARCVSELPDLPLHPLDLIQFKAGGGRVPHADYLAARSQFIRRNQWIIDGFGCVTSAWERFAAAVTLIYIDLPLLTHYRWVRKRSFKSLFVAPGAWPGNNPMWRSTLDSWRVIGRCEQHLAPRYRQLTAEADASKRAHRLRSAAQIRAFVETIRNEYAGP